MDASASCLARREHTRRLKSDAGCDARRRYGEGTSKAESKATSKAFSRIKNTSIIPAQAGIRFYYGLRLSCHPERSDGSALILHCVQNGKSETLQYAFARNL